MPKRPAKKPDVATAMARYAMDPNIDKSVSKEGLIVSGPAPDDDGRGIGHELIFHNTAKGIRLQARFDGETLWLSQAQIAELFSVDRSGITKHINNILEDGELPEEGNVQKMHISPTKPTTLYSLDMAISVGYRVNSVQATRFRIWATAVIKDFIAKGFVIDDERLKNPDGRPDYFDELLERIRDIRASEKRMWMRILELVSFCSDYDPNNKTQPVEFFAEIQNTMHWAVLQMTAPELIRERVDASKENAGLLSFAGKMPTVAEAQTAKNVLHEPEIKALNHITSLMLEFFDSQAEQRRLTTLEQFLGKMRELVKLDGRPLKKPGYAGQVSRPDADKWASTQIRDYKARKRVDAEAAGEQKLIEMARAVRKRAKAKGKKT